MIDLSDLIAKRGVFRDMIDQKVLDVTNKLTLDVHARVVQASPVDTGTFRGAWQAEQASAPYQSGAVTDNVAYGPYLLDGHSKQAPAGWLDNAVQAAAILGGGR